MRLLGDIRWGIPLGLRIAQKFSLFVALPYVLLGDRWLARLGVTFWEILALYTGGGIVVGLILAILRPISRWRTGSILIGVIVALIGFGATLTLGSRPLTHWTLTNWVGVTVAGFVVGAFGGNLAWEENVFFPDSAKP